VVNISNLLASIFGLLQVAVVGAEMILAATVGYLLLLTVAAFRAEQRTALQCGDPVTRFALLIPAHEEERLLPLLLASLRRLDYPPNRYTVHVVADNCSDRTAEIGRAAGAIVHERMNPEQVGKGYALEWLINEIQTSGEPYDALVFLDADSTVSTNFLRVMDARLLRGERVIQAHYAVRDPGRTWGASLRAIALMVLHYLRPLGRMVLGGSAGLKGNGMVFTADIIRRYRWSASLTEDIEYHMALILGGERAMFAPDAVVWAEMPGTLAAAQTQNARWERGRMEMVRDYAPRLLRGAWRRRSFLLLDAAIEQLIPPFAVVAAASMACLIAALGLGSLAGVALGAAIIIGQALYVLAGLRLARAPRKVYSALLYTPVFVVWKVALYLRLLLGSSPRTWIRTERDDL
jgi:1,2-diacylglycerol 3-beta-glucosyltransferase